jgi:transcriptional regulator with XRE-family HTH domain
MWNREHAGASFRRLRLERGLSQKSVARRACVTSGYISRFEQGEFLKPSYEVLARLARALELGGADELAARLQLQVADVPLAAGTWPDPLALAWRHVPPEQRAEAQEAVVRTLRTFWRPSDRLLEERARSASASAAGGALAEVV